MRFSLSVLFVAASCWCAASVVATPLQVKGTVQSPEPTTLPTTSSSSSPSFVKVGSAAAADPLIVMTDIPATHSLVAMVMGTVGEPGLLLQQGASPHDYSLKPSEAAALRDSAAVFWISAELTPWLSRARSSLATGQLRDQLSVELINVPGALKLPVSEGNGIDTHAWLDPDNAMLWLQVIADTLADLDPPHASIYQGNAQRAVQSLEVLKKRISETLEDLHGRPYIVFHDSYQYFEHRFDLPATATISLSDSSIPGIRQINTLRKTVEAHPDICIFSEPQFSNRLVDTITEGFSPNQAVLDPLGSTLTPGAGLYSQLLEQLADSLHDCITR